MSEPVMGPGPEVGPQLVIPLLRLAKEEPPPPVPRVVPRLVDLDEPADVGLAAWASRVRSSDEACLLLDPSGRVLAVSDPCGELLGLDPTAAEGALLRDVVELVDFSAAAQPLPDPAMQTAPLRALRTGGLARSLLRVRRADGSLGTYDAVGVPLARGAGALAFVAAV